MKWTPIQRKDIRSSSTSLNGNPTPIPISSSLSLIELDIDADLVRDGILLKTAHVKQRYTQQPIPVIPSNIFTPFILLGLFLASPLWIPFHTPYPTSLHSPLLLSLLGDGNTPGCNPALGFESHNSAAALTSPPVCISNPSASDAGMPSDTSWATFPDSGRENVS